MNVFIAFSLSLKPRWPPGLLPYVKAAALTQPEPFPGSARMQSLVRATKSFSTACGNGMSSTAAGQWTD
ncbi:Uncharacterised protein [Mobiluncus mulieris]|nr:Uncharacterised protein [Mobiluncus mulieris]